MNPERLMTVPCQIIARTPGEPDPYGGDTITETAVDGRCWYSNPQTEERGGAVFQTMTAYFGPDSVLDNITRVDIEGVGSFEVDGSPLAHRSPRTGVLTHFTARVRRGA